MKYFPLFLLAVFAVCAGCTHTTYTTPTMSVERWSLFQKVEAPRVEITTNGAVTLEGYRNDGGSEATERLVEAAVRGAVKGATAP